MDIESWKIITFLGGIPAVISGIIGAIWILTSKKIILKWTSKENKKLEEIKGSINQNNLMVSNLIDSHSNAYLFAQEKRLDAIEKFWDIYLTAKQLFPSEIWTMYTVYMREELKTILDDYNPQSVIPPLIRKFDVEKYTNKLMKETEPLEKYKIYIDPKLWTYFWVYRAFCGRITKFVDNCKSKNQIEHWTEEKQLNDLLKLVMTDKEITKIYKNYIFSLQFAFDLFEQKIINEITELTTGKKQTMSYLEQMAEFNQMISKNKISV